MPKLGKLNLSEIKAPASVPAGKYTAKLTDCEAGLSRKGDDMWTWTWMIVGGDEDGRTMKSYTMVGPKANLFNLKNHLEGFGITGEINGVNTDSLMGKLVTIVVTTGTRVDSTSGEKIPTSNINGVLPYKKKAPAVAVAPVDDSDDDEDEDEKPIVKKPAPVPDDEDEEEEPPKKKEKTRKAKAEPEPEPEEEDDSSDDLPQLD